jgi:hypothetical protein
MFGTNPHKIVIYYIMINDFSIFLGGWYYRYRCTLSFCGVSIDIHRVFLVACWGDARVSGVDVLQPQTRESWLLDKGLEVSNGFQWIPQQVRMQ